MSNKEIKINVSVDATESIESLEKVEKILASINLELDKLKGKEFSGLTIKIVGDLSLVEVSK